MGVEIRTAGCCGMYLVPGTSGGEIILLHHIEVLNFFIVTFCNAVQYLHAVHTTLLCNSSLNNIMYGHSHSGIVIVYSFFYTLT